MSSVPQKKNPCLKWHKFKDYKLNRRKIKRFTEDWNNNDRNFQGNKLNFWRETKWQISKLQRKPKKWCHTPQDDIWCHPSWAHAHCHVVLWTQRTTPESRRPWGSCTPPNHTKTTTPPPPTQIKFSGKKKTHQETNKIHELKTQNFLTLISLKGISKLFSIFESKPSKRAAWRKLRFVAARAFMVGPDG